MSKRRHDAAMRNYMKTLERCGYDNDDPAVMRARISCLEIEVEDLMEMNTELMDMVDNLLPDDDEDDGDYYPPAVSAPAKKPSYPGLGLRLRTGEEPKLYRTNNPDGPLVPKAKFLGLDFEVYPGHGFSIKPKFGKG